MMPILRPLGAAFLAFLAGLLLALRFVPDPTALIAAALLMAALVVRSACASRRMHTADALALVSCMALAGAACGASGARAALLDCRAAIHDGASLRAEGVLGAGIAPPTRADARPPIIPLERAGLARNAAPGSCAGTVRVRMRPDAPDLPAGTRVVVAGEWVAAGHRVVRDSWPRDPYFSGFLVVDSVITAAPAGFASAPLLTLRGWTESALRALFPTHSPLAEALVLGRRERLDPALRDRFVRSGLVHLLAISGSHVGLFAGMLLIFGAAARLPRRRVAWLCIGVVAVYLAMIGAPASAVRAGIMLSLALVAVILQRPSAAIPMMAAAALVILAFSPAAVLHAGFQLSFAGVAGILVARRMVLTSIPPRLLRPRFVRPLVESVTISAAAFAATAPIVAHHFGQVAPVAIVANLVAAPATAVALSGVIGSVALYPLIPPLAHLVADGASVALDVLDRTATLAAAVPLGHVSMPRPDWFAWTGALLAAAIAWRSTIQLRARTRRAVAAGAALALVVAWPGLARGDRGALEIHFLDVGQGDAIAIRTPSDRWVLIDAGPRGRSYDAGERRVLPFLHAHRVPRLEALVITHPDADHIGGAPAVLRGIHVSSVIDPGLPAPKGLYAELLADVEQRGVPWRSARDGNVLELDGVELRFLWPRADFLDPAAEANQISAVIMVRFGDFEALLTGDVPAEVEHQLVTIHRDGLAAEVLKAGHHGSSTSTSPALLQAVSPELVVVSAGRRNRYGHPAPDVLERVRAAGIDIARTDRDGTITIRALAGAGAAWHRIEQ